ncbi:MAG: copper chaperone PCu(A)C [Sphingomonadales bacterium]|nr:copper chaperone PCu(A)C [Sphingomonadales bacterium]
MNFAIFQPRHVLILAAMALAACQQHKAPEAQASAEAVPDAKPGITVSSGVLMLPAVKGNPGAAYFAVTNRGAQPTSLAAIHIDGAGKVEMHETKGGAMAQLNGVPIEPGQTVKFERGGKHAMVFDLGDKLLAGGPTEMTLTFSGGDKVSAPLKVRSMSDAMGGDLAGMNMDHGSRN